MDELEVLRLRVQRELRARKAAEELAESRTRELFAANEALKTLNATLSEQVEVRTGELRDAAEAALAASSAKSLFLGNVSHELRTPLNAIVGYAELLGEELEQRGLADLAEDAARIIASSHHLLALVNDLLDLQKVESGQMVLQFAEIDIRATLAVVVDGLQPALRAGRNTLTVELDPAVDGLYSDELRVRQILFNLLSNAAKFTRDGKIHVRVRVEGAGLLLEVEDSGIGMSPEQLARLFTPYVQVSAELARRLGGTGLGLALTRRLCQLLGGDIDVESVPGSGSRFRVTLPRHH
jgi:signal transduction histidine kinase